VYHTLFPGGFKLSKEELPITMEQLDSIGLAFTSQEILVIMEKQNSIKRELIIDLESALENRPDDCRKILLDILAEIKQAH
jgi:hypothetical protein